MTMNKIMAKLRKNSKGQYTLLGVCIFLSVLMVSAFAFLYFSPTVQELLPTGGDTRKLSWLLFFVTAAGCTIFTIYGADLFFKNKSREFGVFLALGEQKRKLEVQLFREVALILLKYVFLGILAAIPVSWLIWKAFSKMLIGADQMRYRFTPLGIAAGLLFTAFLILCIGAAGIRFVKRTNIMDILNDWRKTEMVKEIKPWTGKLGLLLIIIGLLLAMAVPQLSAHLFLQLMPPVWNLTWLISLAGLYLFLLSAVAHSGIGKKRETYYKNIISTNLMRFTARQTTRNMCVIALLIFVILISAFWGIMYYVSAFINGDNAPVDYSLHYPAAESQLTKAEIEGLADEYGVDITLYEETKALELIIRYVSRDYDDNGKYFDIETEKLASFVSASDFTRISGISVTLSSGEYRTVVRTNYQRTIWVGPDCLQAVTNPVTGDSFSPVFQGTTAFENLALMSDPFVFIISDEDYLRLSAGLDEAWMENMVFFNVKDVYSTYAFAHALQDAFIGRATALSDHLSLYDAHEEKLAAEAGKSYSYSGTCGLFDESGFQTGSWKYAPFIKVLTKQDAMQLVAVFVLLSIYISILSLTACSVMSYVRSLTVALDNKNMFADLRRLGAAKAYTERVLRIQLKKIYLFPTAAGCIIGILFAALLTFFNDMRIDVFELNMLGVVGILIVVISAVMYIMYRVSLKKAEAIAEI